MKLFRCNHCGNIFIEAYSKGVPVSCCGEKMELVEPKTADSATEKHVPVVTVDGNKVSVVVGSTIHPMTAEHFITGIMLETEKTLQVRWLTPTDKPEAEFIVADGEKLVAVYEYCNLHGLWKTAL